MDSAAFDRLTRLLATTPSRRGLGTVLTGAVTTLVTRLGVPAPAAAQARTCRALNRPCFPARGLDCCEGACRDGRCRCPRRQRACRGQCIPKRQCCTSRQCVGGLVCRIGRCQCPAGKRRCGPRCIAQAACCQDRECGVGERCVNGSCRCAPDFKRCQGRCIPANQCCQDGDCGRDGVCVTGTCHCAAGFQPCRGGCIPAGDCCRANDCDTNEACVAGQCQCAAGAKPCNDGCILQAECCGGCAADQNCVAGACVPKPCGQGGVCRVFVTSGSYNGDLRVGGTGSGIAGADAKCQALADASPRTQGGTYKAWVSGVNSATSPSERFTNTANTGPYVRVDDAATVIANNWADLTDGTLQNPINVNERGEGPPNTPTVAWTSTLGNGTPGGALGGGRTCRDWTSPVNADIGSFGFPTRTDGTWTAFSDARCQMFFALYCFEQG